MKPRDDAKARILRNIVVWLNMGHNDDKWSYVQTVAGERRVRVNYQGDPVAQFVRFGGQPPVGTIVKCMTNPNHDWGISRFVSAPSSDSLAEPYVLREIGSDRLLNMYNEMLHILIGMPEHLLLEGWDRKMYLWACKAFTERWNPDADYFNTRMRKARIVGGCLNVRWSPHIISQPNGKRMFREICIPVSKKTRLKDIVAALRDDDFAREWTDDDMFEVPS